MTTFELITAGLYVIPMLVWAVITRQSWAYRRRARPRSRMFHVAPFATGAVTLHAVTHVAWALVPAAERQHPTGAIALLNVVFETSALAMLAIIRHWLRLLPIPESVPGRAWLAVNYGPPAAVAVVFAWARLSPTATAAELGVASVLVHAGMIVLGTLALWKAVQIARPGAWGPEGAGEMRRPDIVIIGWTLAASVGAALVAAVASGATLALVVFELGTGLGLVTPWALRMLGVVVPEFLVGLVLLVATGGLFAVHAWAASFVDPSFRPLLTFAAVIGLLFVLAPVQAWLRAWITRLLFRRSLRQQEELQAFVQTLSPELGMLECCRRALAELVRVRGLAGAAILLDDGQTIVHGTFDVEPLLRVWPRGAAADGLPKRSFGSAELREMPLPLREALIEANVGLGASPIASPRRRWGHLFMNTGLLGGTFREDDLETFQAFVAQLALVLAGAELLGRAVAVERSLAHAEKLAAIGELAARIAHDIRNPVTAARSLAQQLARESASPHAAEHALILEELERVERQVAALLRFARREEFRFEPVALGPLVHTTVATLRPRLEAADIRLRVDARDGITARADPEKLRHVLINVMENAIDALADAPEPRRLAVVVASTNGTASIEVRDSGPGVSADALAHLFQPFFTLKPHGTGLGLAIAKRTVEAHGGHITATAAPDGGMTFAIELPLGEGA